MMVFGLFAGPRRRERWMLLLPVATVLPAALLVSMKVRYLVPVMAPAFVCVAVGALALGSWLNNKFNWISPPVVAFGLIGVFCWSSYHNPHSKAALHMAELT